MNHSALIRKGLVGLGMFLTAPAAFAQENITGLETVGKPTPNGINFQEAVTELAHDIHWLDNFLLVIITLITLFVLGLLAVCVFRYSEEKNPVPATFTHNTQVETAWTVIPIVILVVIGSLSLPILFKQLEIPEADVTIKVTGHQWYWSYEYPDNDIEFDSYMLQREELAEYGYAEDEFLLATDTAMVVPVGQVVRLQVTGGDVIHAWKIPSFGVHMDGIPGRLNETWFQADKEGVYFGQCSELCGKDHSYMPITVKVVSVERYQQWIEASGGTVAAVDVAPVQVAQAD